MTTNKLNSPSFRGPEVITVTRGIIAFVILLGVTINTSGCSTQSNYSTRGNTPVANNAGTQLAVVPGKYTKPDIPSTGSRNESIKKEQITGGCATSGVVDSTTNPNDVDVGSQSGTTVGSQGTSAFINITPQDLTPVDGSIPLILDDSKSSDPKEVVGGVSLVRPDSKSNPADAVGHSALQHLTSNVAGHVEGSSAEFERLAGKRIALESQDDILDVSHEELKEKSEPHDEENSESEEIIDAVDLEEAGQTGLDTFLNQCYPVDMFGQFPGAQIRSMSILIAHTNLIRYLMKLDNEEQWNRLRLFDKILGPLGGGEGVTGDVEVNALIAFSQSTFDSVVKSFCVDSDTFEKTKDYQIDCNVNFGYEELNTVSVREWVKYFHRISEGLVRLPDKVCMPVSVILDVIRERLECVRARMLDDRLDRQPVSLGLDTGILGIMRAIDPLEQIAEINEIKQKTERYLRNMIEHIDGILDRVRRRPIRDDNQPFSRNIEDAALALMLTNDPDITFDIANRQGLYNNFIALIRGYTDFAIRHTPYHLYPNELLRWGATHLQQPGVYDTNMLLAYAVTEYVRDEQVRVPGMNDGGNVDAYFLEAPSRGQIVGIIEKFRDGIEKMIDGTLPLVADDPLATVIANGDMQMTEDRFTALITRLA